MPPRKNTQKVENNERIDFYFKNLNNADSFQKIKSLRRKKYSIDFDPKLRVSDLTFIHVILVDSNKCIGLYTKKEFESNPELFEGIPEITI